MSATTTLYVGNLPLLLGAQAIHDRFAAIGKVISVQLDAEVQKSRRGGSALVEMSTSDEAKRAIARFNMTELDGHIISVTKFRAAAESPAFSGLGRIR